MKKFYILISVAVLLAIPVVYYLNIDQTTKPEYVDKLIDLLSIKKTLQERYSSSYDLLEKIPSYIDETYKTKKTVATQAKNQYKEDEKKILSVAEKKVQNQFSTEFSTNELSYLTKNLEKHPEYKDSSDDPRFVKLRSFIASKRLIQHIKYPQTTMTKYYQHYLDAYRKKYGIPEGSFVIPNQK